MIERVQAKSMIMLKTSGNAKAEVIDKIYDSRGRCDRCKFVFEGEQTGRLFCDHMDDKTVKPDFFCGHFEPKDN